MVLTWSSAVWRLMDGRSAMDIESGRGSAARRRRSLAPGKTSPALVTLAAPWRRQESLIRDKRVLIIALEVAAVRGADTVTAGDAHGSGTGDRRVAVAGILGVAASQPPHEPTVHGVPGAQRHRDPHVAPTAVLERRLAEGRNPGPSDSDAPIDH